MFIRRSQPLISNNPMRHVGVTSGGVNDFGTSVPFKQKSSDYPHKLKLLTNFYVNLTSFLVGVTNYVLNEYSYHISCQTLIPDLKNLKFQHS